MLRYGCVASLTNGDLRVDRFGEHRARRQHDLAQVQEIGAELAGLAEDRVLDLADQLLLHLLDALLEPLVDREVVVDQVIPELVEQEARALREPHEVSDVRLAHRLEEHGRALVQGQQVALAHHRVDALEVELVPDEPASRQHQVDVVLVAGDLVAGSRDIASSTISGSHRFSLVSSVRASSPCAMSTSIQTNFPASIEAWISSTVSLLCCFVLKSSSTIAEQRIDRVISSFACERDVGIGFGG